MKKLLHVAALSVVYDKGKITDYCNRKVEHGKKKRYEKNYTTRWPHQRLFKP